MDLDASLQTRFWELGDLLATEFSLVGLFGVDAILRQGDAGPLDTEPTEICPLEVNPRYTASVEVLERAIAIEPIRWHVAACNDPLSTEVAAQGGAASASTREWPESIVEKSAASHGKAILFAKQMSLVAERFVRWTEEVNRNAAWPTIADIPAVGTVLEVGQPIVSLFAAGPDERAVIIELKKLAAEIKAQLA